MKTTPIDEAPPCDAGAIGPRSDMTAVSGGGLPRFGFSGLGPSPGLAHAIFSRCGGVSRGRFSTLNVAFGVGDEPAAVRENRRRIQRTMSGMTPVFLRQCHGTRTVCIKGGAVDAPLEADAVITDRPGLLLVIQVADCQAVVVHDPVRQVVANIHSGWRGSVGNIVGKTVAAMKQTFGCRPADMVAGIGPSLGPCCAEFIHYRTEIPPALWRHRIGERHFDFWSMSLAQLKDSGLAEEHVRIAGVCTRCRTDLFYSYRAEKTTGRFAVAAGLAGHGGAG